MIIRFRTLAAAFLLAAAATPAMGQTTNPPVTVPVQGPSGLDVLRYGYVTFDRTLPGSRAKSMGGAGLALSPDVNGASLNPANFSLLSAPELSADTRWMSGSSTATDSPEGFPSPLGTEFPIREYSPSLTRNYTYNDLAFGMPLIFLGLRAGVGATYRRLIDFRSGSEERFVVESPFGEADFGAGEQYKGGVDSFSPSFSVSLASRFSLGATLNFMTGDITSEGDQGVTSFGQVVTSGFVKLDQEVNGTSVDFGGRFDLTPSLSFSGVLQTGHDLKFTSGDDQFQGLLDPTDPDPTPIIYDRALLDHTLSVPAMYGLGMAWRTMNNRLTLAADYWNRGWSKATFTRQGFSTLTVFPDSLNLGTNFTAVIPNGTETQKKAGFKDTNSFRIGGEWLVKGDGGAGMTIPLRLGFRNEPRSFANIDTTEFNALVKRIDVAAGAANMPVAERQAIIADAMDEIFQNGSLLLEGDDVPATTVTFGTGIKVDSFSFDLGLAWTSYEFTHLFLGSFNDFTRNIHIDTVTEDRSFTEMNFTATLRF
ncbi:MAG TPA: hypothetical protein VF720_02530 [Candidatus Eisenbacteria bacterium]